MAKKKIDLNHSDYTEEFIESELYADYDITSGGVKNKKKARKQKNKRNARNLIEEHFDREALRKKVIDWDNYLNS